MYKGVWGMSSKKITAVVMLLVLAAGIALMVCGTIGSGIYDNAAKMTDGDRKAAIGYMQDPSTLYALSDLDKKGPENVKKFLTGLGMDSAAVSKAVDERAAYEESLARSKNRENFLAFAKTVDPSVTEDNLTAVLLNPLYCEPIRRDMIMADMGITDFEEYNRLANNEDLLVLYRQALPKLLDNSLMMNGVMLRYIGLILVVVAGAYFLIRAMDIRPRARTRAKTVSPKKSKVTGFLLNYALYLILGLILVVVSIIRIDFLSMNTILNILQNASTKGILALGCAGLIVLAGTDLSIGRVLGISAAVTASLVQSTTYASRMFPTLTQPLGFLGLLVPLFASIAVAVVFSLINGFGVARLHLHAFIVTLGTQLIAYGANCLYIESQPSGTAQALSTFDPAFLDFAAGAFYIGSVRVPLVIIYFLLLAVVVWFIWNKTRLGKNMFAVGGNTEAAAVSGVNVGKTIMLVYLMAGVLYGIAAFLEAGRITSVGTNTGLNYELDAISAVVVGGVSFSGGVGTIQGVVIGAVVMQAIVYALQFLGINAYLQYIIRGLIIILAVAIDVRKYIVKK